MGALAASHVCEVTTSDPARDTGGRLQIQLARRVRISARCAVENLGERRPVGGQIINGQETHAMTMMIANFFFRMHGHRRTRLHVYTP